jgi:hypothetical protein
LARDNSELDKKLLEGFENSLISVLGESGAKALMKLGNVPEDKFDAKAIDSSLGKVFGASDEGLSIIQKKIINGMSETLKVSPPPVVEPRSALEESERAGFVLSLEAIANRYRLKEKAGFGVAGFAAGMISSICCLGPIAFALLGLASLSSSLTLAMNLTATYKPLELAASVGFLGITVILQLRRHNECSLSGLRRNLAYVIVPTTVLLVTYAIVNYWVGIAFFGGPGNIFPFP